MKVGLFGGTFNPIHNGHLRGAIEVLERCGLDKVIMLPVCQQPLKGPEDSIAPQLRLDMVRLAVQDLQGIEVSDAEIRRGGKSYTIDTYEYYRGMYPHDEFFIILGKDAYASLKDWHRGEELRQKAQFIVTNRPGAKAEFYGGYKPQLVEVPELHISSSEIRAKVKNGQSIKFLVPEVVYQFIFEKGIYS